MASTPSGEFLAVGNGEGEVATYDVATGQVIKIVEADRDFKHLNLVRAAGVSRDCRHVHAAFGPGIVWRFEVVPELDDEDDGTEGPGTPPEGTTERFATRCDTMEMRSAVATGCVSE